MMRVVATYAGALAAAAPLAFVTPAFAQASQAENVELIGTVSGMVEVDRPSCPPDYLCLNSTYRMTLANIQHLSGPAFDNVPAFTISLHSAYRPGMIVRVTVRDTGGEHWEVIENRIMGYDEAATAPER